MATKPSKINVQEDDPFWVNDPLLLIRTDRLMEFYPSTDMTANERMNAVTRYVLYAGIIITFLKKENSKPFILAIIAILVMAVLFYPKSDKTMLTMYYNKKRNCIESTKDNPYMNLMADDPQYSEKRLLPPCDEEPVDDNDNDHSRSNFYTVPRDFPRNQ